MRQKIKKAGKKNRKVVPLTYHDGLSKLRWNAGGIDIGASEVWVDVGSKDAEPMRVFETFTADLNRMGDWLKSCGIETVAMESTGVYWIPVCQILESKGIEVYLVNAKMVKNVSGTEVGPARLPVVTNPPIAMDYCRHRFGRRKTLGSCAPT